MSRLTEQRAAKASIKETLSSTVETRKHDMLTQKLVTLQYELYVLLLCFLERI